ncbi:MAG: hypothetical protein ABIZ04_25730 [Opitutus sp.]
MNTARLWIVATGFLVSCAGLPAEEGKVEKAKEAVKETAHDVADATKRAATATKEKSIELYDKAAAGTKHAAEVTKEKSREAYAATKEATIKAKDKTVAVSKVVAEKAVETGKVAVEKTKEAAVATKEKAIEFTTTKEELARYDANHDERLDADERAAMKAAKAKPAETKESGSK